jgi:hypothetical protein
MSMTDRASKALRWRLRPAILLAALITVASLGIAGWYVAKTSKPIGNTEPYRAAHGVVPGRVNELRVKGVLLRFPASYRVEPQTADEIVHGQADSVSLEVDMSHLLPVSESRPAGNRRVWIELGANFYEDPQRNWAGLASRNWKSIHERPDLGMREFTAAGEFSGWGDIVYAGSDPRWRTPKGGPIIFNCVGLRGEAPSQCRTGYQDPRGPYIRYHIYSELLPHLRQVHAEVVRLVDSFIVG